MTTDQSDTRPQRSPAELAVLAASLPPRVVSTPEEIAQRRAERAAKNGRAS